ncbi:MAG: hypothetical protein FWE20_05570 [Defluviitaleaceae bacterium]|nr:hypothetical protein [Defluviitaleaceae bacterium]
MKEEENDLTRSFPEDDFDLERFKRKTLVQKREKKARRIVVKPPGAESGGQAEKKPDDAGKSLSKAGQDPRTTQEHGTVIDNDLIKWDDTETFFMSDFDLDDIHKKAVTKKRDRFWKRNTKLFYLISTLIMIVLFVIAFFAFHFIMDFITNFTDLR